MSQLYSSEWTTLNNNGTALVKRSPLIFQDLKLPFSLRTPRSAEPTRAATAKVARGKESYGEAASQPCGVCQRLNCELKSHQAYLLAKESNAGNKPWYLASHHACSITPKKVDNHSIRTAFTQSYAFNQPSYLSKLRPNSFRLGVFHDLPVTGGDRPEMHKLLWHFLNFRLEMLQVELQPRSIGIENLRETCLTLAMTDPRLCMCMIIIERVSQEPMDSQLQFPLDTTHNEHHHSHAESLDPDNVDQQVTQRVSEAIVGLLVRCVIEYQRDSHSTAVSRPFGKSPIKNNGIKTKLLILDDTIA